MVFYYIFSPFCSLWTGLNEKLCFWNFKTLKDSSLDTAPTRNRMTTKKSSPDFWRSHPEKSEGENPIITVSRCREWMLADVFSECISPYLSSELVFFCDSFAAVFFFRLLPVWSCVAVFNLNDSANCNCIRWQMLNDTLCALCDWKSFFFIETLKLAQI